MSKKHKGKGKKSHKAQENGLHGCTIVTPGTQGEKGPEVKERSVYTHTYTFDMSAPFWGSVWSSIGDGSTWNKIAPSSPKGENTCRALVPYGYCFDEEKEGTLEYV